MIKKTNTLPVGYRLHQYRIESVLGAGGFGITYKAVHEALQTRAAVKEYFPVEWSYRDRDDVNVLANTQGGSPTSEAGEDACYSWGLERFLNEAQILGKIDHPGVVRVRDFFEANGTAYIVMDYVEGESLGQMLQRERSLTEEQVRRLVEDVLPALEAEDWALLTRVGTVKNAHTDSERTAREAFSQRCQRRGLVVDRYLRERLAAMALRQARETVTS